MVLLPRVSIHSDRLVDRIGDLLTVPGVDDETSVQTLSCTCKLGDDHHTLPSLLTCDVLVGHLFLVSNCISLNELERTRFMPSLVLLTRQTSLTA